MTTSCSHCGQPVAAARAVGEATEAPRFCCGGCATVWSVLHDAGLHSYYQMRERLPDPGTLDAAVEDAAADRGLDRPEIALRFVRTEGGRASVTFAIDGIHCASCGWVIERLLEADPGVAAVAVSVGRERVTVEIAPQFREAPPLGRIAARLATAGYAARPLLDPDGADEDPAARAAHRLEALRLGVAAACTMNIMLFAVSLYGGEAWGMDPSLRGLFRWLSMGLAAPILGFSAAPILRRAVGALRAGVIHVDVPVAVAILVMFGASAVATVQGVGHVWFDSLGMLVVLLLGGRALEALVRRRAAGRIGALHQRQDTSVQRVDEGGRSRVPSETLVPGQRFELSPGCVSPVDGLVLEGVSEIDLSAVDGEPSPQLAEIGAAIPSGARILDGVLQLEVVRSAADSNVALIRAAVQEALGRRGAVEQLADVVARWFVVVVLGVATITAAAWWRIDPSQTVPIVVAVLVVACPCALALATPLSFAAAVHGAAAAGLLVRDGGVLLELGSVTGVAFDKTGTLTEARPRPGALDPAPGATPTEADDALRLAAALCVSSHHPVARAVVAAWRARAPGPLPVAQEVREVAGVGVSGRVSGHAVAVRRPGATLWIDGAVRASLALTQDLRPGACEAVSALTAMGIRSALLSGDEPARTLAAAGAAGVDWWQAAQSPADKARWIADRQRRGERWAFVGDGANDGPALAEATAGLAIGGAVDVALEAADGAAVTRRPVAVVHGIRLGRALRATLITNVVISLTYNAVTVSAAAAGFITPLVAAALMPLSSLVVVVNAARLAKRRR